MYAGKRILALIPARSGSKGIKHKNIIELCGKPLISYTIAAGLHSAYIDRTIVSTDSDEIANISRKFGAEIPFMRPPELATDTSKTIDVVLHALRALKANEEEYDVIILLQPTQPLRTDKDIDEAIEMFFKKDQRSLASISLVDDHPLLVRTINKEFEISALLDMSSTCRRQDMPKYYRINGCIYINKIDEITEHTSFNDNILGFVMEPSHSVDIDELKDLVLAEYYLNQ